MPQTKPTHPRTKAPCTSFSRVVVILNRAAGGGQVGRHELSMERTLRERLGPIELVRTQGPGDGLRRARLAVEQGADTLLSIGGDGTHSEVVNGIMAAHPEPGQVAFGVIHAGTGGDFRRLLRQGNTLEETLDLFSHPRVERIDLGRVRFTTGNGEPDQRYFLNLASAGLGGHIDRIANRSSKRLGGKATFLMATLRALASYQAPKVRLTVDGVELPPLALSSLVVANGRYAGGGMKLAPRATLNDGLLDVAVIGDGDLKEQLRLLPKLYDGTYIDSPLVEVFRCQSLSAVPCDPDGEPAWLDIDGESPGRLPARFDVIPGALTLLNPLSFVVN